MPPLPTVDRFGDAGIWDVRREIYAERSNTIERYKLDPVRPLLEGRIKVWNPVTFTEERFEPFPNQIEDIVSWIDVEQLAQGQLRLRHTHVEKSRQEGDTTAFVYAMLWILTYWPSPLLVLHEALDEVCDSGPTYDSIFGKIKFMHERWPSEIGKAPLSFTGGNNPIIRRQDDPTAFIVGDSGHTPNPGRGGRYAGALIDEAARIRYARQAQAALTSAVPQGRVMLSTPFGEGNVYYEIRDQRPHGWIYLRHHWTDHPIYSRGLHIAGGKPETCVRCAAVVAEQPYDPHDPDGPHRYPGRPTSPWYDQAVLELTDEQVAQELDIDYAGSLTGRVYPEFDPRVHVAEREIPWDPYLRIETAWDYGLTTSVVICQEGPLEQRVIGEVETEGTPEAVAEAVEDELRSLGLGDREFGVRDTWLNVGDPAGESKQMATLAKLTSQYAAAGYSISSQPTKSIRRTIDSVKRLLGDQPKPLRVSPRCTRFISHMKANRWPVDTQGQRKPSVTEPVNDEHNHMMRAFAYLIYWKWPAPEPEDAIAAAQLRLAEQLAEMSDDSGRIDPGIEYDMKF